MSQCRRVGSVLNGCEKHRRGLAGVLQQISPMEFERTLIRVALARSEGRRQDAARVLGWGRNTLTRKMRELGMDGGAVEEVTAA